MASVWDGISPEQRGKIEETFNKTGIPGLVTLVKRYPEHWKDILNYANTLKRTRQDKKRGGPFIIENKRRQLDEWIKKQNWEAHPVDEKVVEEASKRENIEGKEGEEEQQGPRHEDRTPSKDKADEYPVDKEIDDYLQYMVDSFIDSLKDIGRNGRTDERDKVYQAARRRFRDFYIFAKNHSKEKNKYKLEDYTKQFKVPDNWKADEGSVPERIGQLMSTYRKVQLYDFRYTIESGNNRFTNEYNKLYTLFYCLFLACSLIKENPDKYLNKKFKFQGVGTESFQSINNKCIELIKKIHKDTLGEDAELEDLNIKNQSNKVENINRNEVVDAAAESAEVAAENAAKGESEAAQTQGAEAANASKAETPEAKAQKAAAKQEVAKELAKEGIDPNSPEAQKATEETIQAQEAAAQDKDKDTSKFDLAWWIKIKKEYNDYIKGLGKNKDQIANSQVVKVLDKLYATPNSDKQLFNLQQGNIYLGCTHIYSAVFPANNKIGFNVIERFYPLRDTQVADLDEETNKKAFKDRMAEKRDKRELQREMATAADQVKKEVDKAPEIVKLIPNKNNTGTTSKAWHANAVRVWCVTKLLFKLLPGKLEGDEIKDDWLNKMRNHYAEKLKDCPLNQVIGNKDIYSRATGDLYDQKTHHILVPTDTNDDTPSAEKFIFAFYDQLLVPVGDPKETLKRLNASLEALPTETAENLKALLYKTHVQTKSRKEKDIDITDKNYNPTNGLNVLCDYLKDLYDKETRKQYGKEWKIPTVDNEYAMKADALYRILCQGEMKQDSLFVTAFKKYITMVGKYVLANNETKNRERVVTRL